MKKKLIVVDLAKSASDSVASFGRALTMPKSSFDKFMRTAEKITELFRMFEYDEPTKIVLRYRLKDVYTLPKLTVERAKILAGHLRERGAVEFDKDSVEEGAIEIVPELERDLVSRSVYVLGIKLVLKNPLKIQNREDQIESALSDAQKIVSRFIQGDA